MSEAAGQTADTMEIMELMKLLPHRYPFLLVDRIVDIDADNSAVGIKNVSVNEPHFLGHFPGNPVMPGVLIVEAMAQTAGAICVKHIGQETAPLVYFMTIESAKFRRPVVPGDRLEIHVKKLKRRSNLWRFACEALVDGAKAAEAEISAMLVLPNGA